MSEAVPRGFPRAHLPALLKRVEAVAGGLKAVGETIAGVDYRPDGSFRVLTGERAAPVDLAGEGPNEWDSVLPRQ